MIHCDATTASGSACQAHPLPGTTRCYFHTEGRESERQAARKRGGSAPKKAAVLPPDTPPLRLECVADIRIALAQLYNQVRVGEIDAKTGNCLSGIAANLTRTIEGADHEARIAELERAAAGRAS